MTQGEQDFSAATICRNPVPDWKIQVPKRACDLNLRDEVVVDDGADSWPISHLLISSRTRTVRAEPGNPNYPSCLQVSTDTWVTVLLNPSQVGTPRPCGQRFTPHAPKQQGWYANAGGWEVACGCGWTTDEVVPGNKGDALAVWDVHKAVTINALLARNDRGHAAARLQHMPHRLDHLVAHRKYRLVRLK